MIKIQIAGVTGLQKELKQVCNKQKISDLLTKSVLAIEAEAKLRCPVATGRLQKSITHHKISDLTFEVVATADYADYVEYGTMYMTSGTPEQPFVYMGPTTGKYPSYRPFLRSAAYDKWNQIVALIQQEFNKK